MAKAIPDRWTAYKSCGSVIEGTNFICFKVPLRKAVQQNRKEIKEIWDIDTLLAKIPGLGAVIDLTNTARYYDPSVLETVGVRHKKILIPGREIPPESKVKEFQTAVDKFLKYKPAFATFVGSVLRDVELMPFFMEEPDPDRFLNQFLHTGGSTCLILTENFPKLCTLHRVFGMIVGVHCTHGLNRTGYMVCRYMRDRLGIPAGDAIEKFETARGYHVERKNYIADLLGEKPPPPDKGRDTPVKPVKGKHKGAKRRFEINIPGKQNSVYPDNPDKLKSCGYAKPGDKERSRRGNKTVDGPTAGANKNDACLSWRHRSSEDEADSEFHNFGQHRPRESASGSWRNSGDGSRKMYGRPSAQSSKYSFDYRYDY